MYIHCVCPTHEQLENKRMNGTLLRSGVMSNELELLSICLHQNKSII